MPVGVHRLSLFRPAVRAENLAGAISPTRGTLRRRNVIETRPSRPPLRPKGNLAEAPLDRKPIGAYSVSRNPSRADHARSQESGSSKLPGRQL